MKERNDNAAKAWRPTGFLLVRPAIALLVPVSIGICLAFRTEVISRVKSSITEFLEFLYYQNENLYLTFALLMGIPLKRVMPYANGAQLEALKKGIPLKQALQCTNTAQVYALKREIPLHQALRFTNNVQVEAFKGGINLDQALRFTNNAQVEAFKEGINLDEALKCTNSAQVYALKREIPLHQALRFTNNFQVDAFKTDLTITVDQALKCTTYFQVEALQIGSTLEHALQFTDKSQLRALRYLKKQGAGDVENYVPDALLFKTDKQADELETSGDVVKALCSEPYSTGCLSKIGQTPDIHSEGE